MGKSAANGGDRGALSDAENTRLPWLNELNPQQRAAVTHGDGPLLVVAGAGSGKTKTLACRVAYLIAGGIEPGKILLLTFTRRAAEEMLRRAANTVGAGSTTAGVWGGTFHATANRLLRTHAKVAGLSPDFSLMDDSDAADMMSVVRHDLGLAVKDKRFPRKHTCVDIYSRSVNSDEGLEDALAEHFPWCAQWEEELKLMFREYVKRKQEQSVLDYDDLLLYWEQILGDERVAREMADRFAHVLVDEYQDTNPVQARILQGMRKFNNNVMAVGDDAQSIYSFRAATVRNMLDFPKQFPGATVVTLEQNYRSVTTILDATNLIIAQSSERYTKDLWSSRKGGQRPLLVTCADETRQDEFVVKKILEHYEQGIPLRKQAVLFRTGHLADSLEIELSRRNIPYHKYGGLRFLETAHVKDLVSFLRIIENPRDEIAWFRVLQLLDGVGPSTASEAVRHVRASGGDPRSIKSFKGPTASRRGFSQLGVMIDDILAHKPGNPAIDVERIRRFYDPLLERLYDNSVARKRDVENLERIASGYRSRRQFLTDLTLDPPSSTSDIAGPPSKDEDWLVLSTIHSAKGCEWDVVLLIHASDGCLPSDMATGKSEEIEEERRLAYVAMTRARDFLYVCWPFRYYHRRRPYGDDHSYAQLSRFFTEDVRHAFDMEAFGSTSFDQDDYRGQGHDYDDDIPRKLRSRWD